MSKYFLITEQGIIEVPIFVTAWDLYQVEKKIVKLKESENGRDCKL